MAVRIPIQDILGVCLVAADGNVDKTLKQLVEYIERFQRENDRCFGDIPADMLELFRSLTTSELGIKDSQKDISRFYDDPYFGLDDVTLRQVIRPMLSFDTVVFRSGTTHWIPRDTQDADSPKPPEHQNGYMVLPYNFLDEIAEMFQQPGDCLTKKEIKKLMRKREVNRKFLFRCSRTGIEDQNN